MARAPKDSTPKDSPKAAPKDAPKAATPVPAAGSGGSSPSPAPAYQVLARRYRSKEFDEVVGQEAIARTLRNAIRTGRTAHAYLFTGTRGVGKTSMARIFARALNADEGLSEQHAVAGAIMRGEDLDVIEIDAASNRGIDNARDLIAGAGLLPARGRYKIYIVDEVHMLTTPAFNALLKTMEEPPEHVKFILCTTEPQSVPATIQSRCQRFDFRSIPTARIAEHLRAVLAGEGCSADERVVLQIARLANGSMRDALSLLERLLAAAEPDAKGGRALSWDLLEDIFGLPDDALFERLVAAIGEGRADEALAAGALLLERGLSIERALDLLAERFRWLLLASVCGAETELLEVAGETRTAIARLAALYEGAGAAGLSHLIALCDAVAAKARDSSSPRALYDAALVRMALAEQFADALRLAQGGAASASLEPKPPPKKSPARVAELPTRPAAAPSAPPAANPGSQSLARPAAMTSAAPPPAARAGVPDDFRLRLEAAAASSPRDAALLDAVSVRSFDGRVAEVVLRGGTAGSGFLAGNRELVIGAVRRLAGPGVEVRVVVDDAPRPEAPKATPAGSVPPALREHPIVRAVAELFDATVVSAQPLALVHATAAAPPQALDAPRPDLEPESAAHALPAGDDDV